MSQEKFDELLRRLARLHKYVGVEQLASIGNFFDVSAGEMQLIYMCKLRQGYKLPPLAISNRLLEEVEFVDA